MLENERVTLKPISIKDTNFILDLRNNPEIADHFFSDPPIYDFEHNKWLSSRNKDDLDFIIYYEEQRVGRISITKLDFRHQKGEYGVVLHPDFRGKGIAYDASKLLLDYVFNNLPINKIYLEVFEENRKAINLYRKIGFKEEGFFKEEFFKNGSFKDVIRMSLFRRDVK